MFSVVLLVAVTAGGESVDFGRKGGCRGGGGLFGGRIGKRHHGGGCHGGCYGGCGGAVYAPSYGCYGGCGGVVYGAPAYSGCGGAVVGGCGGTVIFGGKTVEGTGSTGGTGTTDIGDSTKGTTLNAEEQAQLAEMAAAEKNEAARTRLEADFKADSRAGRKARYKLFRDGK
ncbi:MAG: hypothetical protein K2W96_11345 [Gemmataceae bacterium]|nr:hypothetical protein [Gemmataceae bacterium]